MEFGENFYIEPPYCFLIVEIKCKFQPQKVPIDISEKNETKAMQRITFMASNSVNE